MLIVGINYAPETTGIAPYTTEMAEHLAGRGWAVTVLTGMPHYPEWRVRDEYRGSVRSRELRSGVAVRRFRHYTSAGRTAPARALYELTFFAQAISALGLTGADRVLGVVPSLGGGAVAALLARRFGAPLGLIMQDLVGLAAAQSGVPGGRLVAKPTNALEGWIARQADGVAVVSGSFIRHLESAGLPRERIVHLPNWAHVSKPTGRTSAIRAAMDWPVDQQIVLHAGNMGRKQGLENVVRAARLAADEGIRVRFVLMGDGSDRRRLEALERDLPTLQFIGFQPADTFMDVLAAADVLLVNENRNVRDMCLPSKLTSYFRAGRPVVAAVRSDGATGAELAMSRAALVVPPDDPRALLAGVRRLAEEVALVQDMVANGWSYGEAQHDRGRTLERIEEFLAGLS